MILPFLKRRAWVIGLAAVLGLLVRCAGPRPPERSLVGLAQLLADASGAEIVPDSISWEPGAGGLSEMLEGRGVLFLGAARAGLPKDVYRALVRVTRSGEPIDVRRVRNLTNTQAGDDVALEQQAGKAVFATVAYGQIQAVSVLDLAGIPATDQAPAWFDQVLLTINAYQETGRLAGLGRTDIILDSPAREARLKLTPPTLRLSLDGDERELVYDVERRELRGPDGSQPFAAHASAQVYPPKPFLLWAVDTLRAEVGPEPIAWLENRVFGARDAVKRASFSLFGSKSESATLGDEAVAAKVVTTPQGEVSWPPPSIPSIWKEPKAGEGQWTAVTLPFLKKLRGAPDAPPYFYRTFIRPDAKRPYSEVLLIAMDARQLELRMQAGYEDPKPTTGPPGGGRLPSDKSIVERVVGTFNGAFKTTHGEYGMMVDRRVLLPPVKGGATIMVNDQGNIGLGGWPQTTEIPPDIVSFRQNLDPLVEDGKANPTGRFIWGWQLEGTSVLTERTAICVTEAGHLFYAWGKEIDGPTLGRALRQAGCSYGMHLDMNPKHCGFVFTDVINPKKNEFTLQLASEDMSIAPDKFVRWSAKDFFYLTVRDAIPRDASGIDWQADGGTQPAPTWLPSFFAGRQKLGQLEVRLTSIEAGRVGWRVRAGTREPSPVGAPPKKLALPDAELGRVIAALGLGHAPSNAKAGLAFDGVASLEFTAGLATLLVRANGAITLHAPGEMPTLSQGDEAVQLPLLAEGGQLVDEARERGSLRLRGALCITPQGRVVMAEARHDSSDPLASALLRVGCTRVVELDRGSQHPAFIHRAGTATPPITSYETTVLYALTKEPTPRAFRWKHAAAVPSKKPTSYDVELSQKKKEQLGIVD